MAGNERHMQSDAVSLLGLRLKGLKWTTPHSVQSFVLWGYSVLTSKFIQACELIRVIVHPVPDDL